MTTVPDSPVYLIFTGYKFSTFTLVGSFRWPTTGKAYCYNRYVLLIIKATFKIKFPNLNEISGVEILELGRI